MIQVDLAPPIRVKQTILLDLVQPYPSGPNGLNDPKAVPGDTLVLKEKIHIIETMKRHFGGSTKSSKLFAHQSHSSVETDPLNPYRQTDSVNGSTISIRRDYCLTFQCYTRLNAHTTVSFQEHSRYLNNQLMLIDECSKNINLH
ncbi:MAG: hypothetical protein CM1200mP22_15180 [Dehalococcoidia bacterium]|nr:MAG: hypothetical protein CM1200mP22_15180 [Dehalococcoidia bacterium]